MKISQKRYIQGFGMVVVLLAIVRCTFFDHHNNNVVAQQLEKETTPMKVDVPSIVEEHKNSKFFDEQGKLRRHKILSVAHYGKSFPDQNDVQLSAAQRYGVSPVADRVEAEHRKSDLVYIGSNPNFHVDKLNSSIPYLVPQAAILLSDIGKSFFDSLQIKGIPLHKIIVTSVMRSKSDIEKLRNHNLNATENSCHLYGTTFDICYNRYKTVQTAKNKRRPVRDDSLKWVLSEVLNDMRKSERCYVKYEVKQGCFHITVR